MEIPHAVTETMEIGADTPKEAKYPPEKRFAKDSHQAGRAVRKQIKPPGDEVCAYHDAGMPQNHHGFAVSFPASVDQGQANQSGRTDNRSLEHE